MLIEVSPTSAEFWDAPGGSKVVQLANLVKSRLTGDRIEGDNETVEL
ncbi:MAG: Pyridoxamine 5-phosphate oxidase [Nocardioidaceae bacterium]|nr:Pyridoxamine 5-phosphate oxidase [Nocardioidaceae bacterium]